MSKAVYLFKEHQDYQAGKTWLKMGRFPASNPVVLSLVFIILILSGIYLIWLIPKDIGFLIASLAVGFLLISFLGSPILLANLSKEFQRLYRYWRLQRADTIFEATVIKVQEGQFADYLFFNYEKEKVPGRLESHWSIPWPDELETGDTLYILYLDEETHCVL